MKAPLQKLELRWIGKEKRARLEPRVLLEDVGKSHHAGVRRRDGKDIFDNMLIHGDNLLALKALEAEFVGRVKCVYIDPPYNTGNAFEHYDDGLEHSIWLGLMRERLELLQRLLSNDGTIWITLDDNEAHYCKVLCDEIFGRENFIADVIWNSRKSVSNDAILSLNTNHNLVFAKDKECVRALAKKSVLFKGPVDESKFSNPDNDPRGPWTADPMDAPNIRANLTYPIVNPQTGEQHLPPRGRHWRISQEKFASALADNRIVFGKTGNSKPQLKRFLSESAGKGSVMTTLWADVDTTTNATKHSQQLFENYFSNPKPENLIERILTLATNPGDLVLDSFLGSGTTAAVAHKMGRRWIGIELGDHCYTHCKVRLDKVIDGEDAGGITKAVGWNGGGGYRFFELAPTLITKDQWGQEVINRDYKPAMLAEAVCKLEGYSYAPSKEHYFIHGHATEKAFIYVTTNFMRKKNLAAISERLGAGCQLLVCCKAFDKAAADCFENLSVKKIPDAVLKKCEWGHDDYSLNVQNLPIAREEPKIEQMEMMELI
ncbi:MAG: site-specific DNA-methyltransferase [Kiritimatiellae bacterium]|nr:site-specific DNA-methyltransferase [Kiritimatiellia bacterium]